MCILVAELTHSQFGVARLVENDTTCLRGRKTFLFGKLKLREGMPFKATTIQVFLQIISVTQI